MAGKADCGFFWADALGQTDEPWAFVSVPCSLFFSFPFLSLILFLFFVFLSLSSTTSPILHAAAAPAHPSSPPTLVRAFLALDQRWEDGSFERGAP